MSIASVGPANAAFGGPNGKIAYVHGPKEAVVEVSNDVYRDPVGAPQVAEIYVRDAQDGATPIRLTNNVSYDSFPAFSADGRKITFVSDRDGVAEIYVMDADGSNQTRVTVTNMAGTNKFSPAFPLTAQR